MNNLEHLREAVAAAAGAAESAKTLIVGVVRLLRDAVSDEDWNDVEALTDQLDDEADALAEAVVASLTNVPAPETNNPDSAPAA